MSIRNQYNFKLILLLIAPVLVVFAALLVYQSLRFRMVSIEPNGTSSTLTPIIFTFNKPIDPKTAREFELSPRVDGRTYVEGKTVKFVPGSSYKINTDYTAKLKTVYAKNGKQLSEQTLRFRTQFTPIDKLTPQEKQLQEKRSASDDVDDVLIANLPVQNLHYKIDYVRVAVTKNGNTEYPPVITVTLFGILNRPDQRPEYERQIRQYKKEAVDWIKSTGVDPAKYNIKYVPDPDAPQTPPPNMSL